MLVDDPYMVRIEAIHAVHGMASDFTKMTEAWLPKGELPFLRDLMAMAALAGYIANPTEQECDEEKESFDLEAIHLHLLREVGEVYSKSTAADLMRKEIFNKTGREAK